MYEQFLFCSPLNFYQPQINAWTINGSNTTAACVWWLLNFGLIKNFYGCVSPPDVHKNTYMHRYFGMIIIICINMILIDVATKTQNLNIELSGPIFYPIFKMCSTESGPKIRVNPSRRLTIFYRVACLTWRAYLTKNWLTKINPKRNDTKYHLIRIWPNLNLIQIVPEPNDIFTRYNVPIIADTLFNSRWKL